MKSWLYNTALTLASPCDLDFFPGLLHAFVLTLLLLHLIVHTCNFIVIIVIFTYNVDMLITNLVSNHIVFCLALVILILHIALLYPFSYFDVTHLTSHSYHDYILLKPTWGNFQNIFLFWVMSMIITQILVFHYSTFFLNNVNNDSTSISNSPFKFFLTYT